MGLPGPEARRCGTVSAEQVFERAERAGKVVAPAQRHDFAEQRVMPEREVHRMVGADATAVNDEGWDTVF
jgi:hypothetical protein